MKDEAHIKGKLNVPMDDRKPQSERDGKTHMADIFTFYLFSYFHG